MQTTDVVKKIFIKSADHLMKQGKKAIVGLDTPLTPPSSCRYRSPEGLKCALGCLITSEFYTEDLEGQASVESEVLRAIQKSQGLPDAEIDRHDLVDLLSWLQWLHDSFSPVHWKERLVERARELDIDWAPKEKA
jgi:hypothetical protein